MDVYLLQHKERTTIIMTKRCRKDVSVLFSKKIFNFVFTTATTKRSLFQAIMDFTKIHHENISYLVVEAL